MARNALLFTLMIIVSVSCSGLSIDPAVHSTDMMRFQPHAGPGRFDSYLAMRVPFSPVKKLFDQVREKYGVKLKSRGEAHITVVTPPEYWNILKPYVSIEEINEIAYWNEMQDAEFEILGLGMAELEISDKKEKSFYVIVKSEKLLRIRKAIHILYMRRGGPACCFDPLHFYPHITVGFTKRDIHESDGAFKGVNSWVEKIREE